MSSDEDLSGLAPTVERYSHGPLDLEEGERHVERVERQQDEKGRASLPYRAIDILAALERRGAITGTMRQAGEIFQTYFNRANLDPLFAADIHRPMVSGRMKSPVLPGKIEAARESVDKAVEVVGGQASPGGSCLWHVIGLEKPLKQWCIEQSLRDKPITQHEATGVLKTVLGILEKHYDLRA
jgi:hypothetical protein